MRHESGFTLLELLLVVFILSVIALGAVSLVESSDEQFRYEDTRSRLLQLRTAILGSARDELSGYVVDLGELPATLERLARRGAAPAFASVIPEFNGTALDDHAEVRLLKGWRGPYVVLPPSGDPDTTRFRDGWGNVSSTDDALHHGWNEFDASASPFPISSFGSDGAAGGSGDYEADQTLQIVADDWKVNLNDWPVTVVNHGGGDLDLLVSVLYRVGSSWLRVDTAVKTVAAGATETFAFGDTTVPIGRHLLLLAQDTAGTKSPYEDPGAPSGTCPYVVGKVAFRARTLPDAVLLEVP